MMPIPANAPSAQKPEPALEDGAGISPKSFRLLLDATPEAIAVADPSGRILFTNDHLQHVFGYAAEELIGKPVDTLLAGGPGRDKNSENLLSRLEHFVSANNTLDGLRKDNTEFPIEVSSSTIRLGTGPVVICVIRDVTEQRQALHVLQYIGEELRARNKDLEQFTYLASHDLKEPLRSISSFVDLLKDTLAGSPDDTTVQALTFIGNGVERMTQLVHDLLEFSRTGHVGNFEDIDLNQVMDDVRSNLTARLNGSKAILDVGPLPTVKARQNDMRLLFQNLVSNAAKFQPEGRTPHIVVSAEHQDGEWLFHIKDNGIGIDPEEAEAIFRPFHRLHDREAFEGTGIGLAHCQKIVERHDGRIWVTPNRDKGSTFHFTLAEH